MNFYEIGISIKPRFFIKNDIAIKPGLNFGYRLSQANFPVLETNGFALNVSLELQKRLANIGLNGEIGFLSQPYGESDQVEVTFTPIFYLGVGITF